MGLNFRYKKIRYYVEIADTVYGYVATILIFEVVWSNYATEKTTPNITRDLTIAH